MQKVIKHWKQALVRRWSDRNLWPQRRGEWRLSGKKPSASMPLLACASVIIPTLNEAKRIAEVVHYALADPVTAEVIVIDDGSIDDTVALALQAGAKVWPSSMLGKGASMQDGLAYAQSEWVVFLDGDLSDLQPGVVSKLCEPLLRQQADFVKAKFGRSGGRVTELTAKPMLKIFFPELMSIAQPLGGIVSGRKSLLQSIKFEDGYGVDVGLLIDVSTAGAWVAEVDIGSLAHDSQPLEDLALMASEVGRVIFARAKAVGRLNLTQISAMYELQRQAAAGIDYVLMRRKSRDRVLLLDMDGTVTFSRFVLELARAVGCEDALNRLLDTGGDAITRSEKIAALFRHVHREHFENVARAMVLRPGVVEFVRQMRRRGFMVGLVSDSYFVAAEIIRRRIFADFAMAHVLQFEADICSGKLHINSAFVSDENPNEISKRHVLQRFLQDRQHPPVRQTWAVGDHLNDLPLLEAVDRGYAIEPKAPELIQHPQIRVVHSFSEILAQLNTLEPMPWLEP